MRMPSRPLAVVSVLVGLVVIAAAFLMIRSPEDETCFERLGGHRPSSNTPRLDTWIDVPRSQWPAAAQIFRDFAAEHGWSLQEGPGRRIPDYFWLDMCDDAVTVVRANTDYEGEGRIGFGIIHMIYQGPEADGWQPFYRDLHGRFEARWPGRLRYVEGEFGQAIDRPAWLDLPEAVRQ